jgi:hypothetical protein
MGKSESYKRWAINVICWVTLLLIAAHFVYRFFPETFSHSSRHRWPSAEEERNTERQQILRRIESAGGWTALKRDCDILASQHQDFNYTWFEWPSNPNPLPPAIAALQPIRIDYYCPKEIAEMKKLEVGPGGSYTANQIGTNVVVRIWLFGQHSTGGHDLPGYGLEVLCETSVTNYMHFPTNLTYRKVAEGIYEFF